jgi:hypothetical protein
VPIEKNPASVSSLAICNLLDKQWEVSSGRERSLCYEMEVQDTTLGSVTIANGATAGLVDSGALSASMTAGDTFGLAYLLLPLAVQRPLRVRLRRWFNDRKRKSLPAFPALMLGVRCQF